MTVRRYEALEMKLFVLETQSFVQNVAQLGNDELIYRVARVCTGAGFDAVPTDSDALERFIYNLLKKKHMRCFELTGIVFGIRCPIFVERQLRTYRKPELERSLRFTEPIEATNRESKDTENPVANWKKLAVQKYQNLRLSGWKKEEARRVLPLDTLTEVVSYYTLRSLFHVFEERLQPPAQSETSQIVDRMYAIAKQLFPTTFKAYERFNRNSRESLEDFAPLARSRSDDLKRNSRELFGDSAPLARSRSDDLKRNSRETMGNSD